MHNSKKKKTLTILAGWCLIYDNTSYYTESTHCLYIKQIAKIFKHVIILAPTDFYPSQGASNFLQIIDSPNVEIKPLPYWSSHIGAQKHWFTYRNKIKEISNVTDIFYCRVPDPFCWMPAKLTDKPVIMHFVGDTIDATKNNIHFSWLKKRILLAGYWFADKKIRTSARKSTVYTNGGHLAEQLSAYGIHATPVISSTTSKDQLATQPFRQLSATPLTLIYIGYLRYAKGIDILMQTIDKLEAKHFNYFFHIVGDGEMRSKLEEFIRIRSIHHKVKLHGYIDDRHCINELLRASDLFFFASLSEGSPRVVIEAISQGCPVLSTPVGSLPTYFKEDKEILFFPFNDADTATKKIIEASENIKHLDLVRCNAYSKIKELTIEKFIQTITTK